MKKIRPDLIEIADKIDPNMDIGVQSDSSSDSSSSSSSSGSESESESESEKSDEDTAKTANKSKNSNGGSNHLEQESNPKRRKCENEQNCVVKNSNLNREHNSNRQYES